MAALFSLETRLHLRDKFLVLLQLQVDWDGTISLVIRLRGRNVVIPRLVGKVKSPYWKWLSHFSTFLSSLGDSKAPEFIPLNIILQDSSSKATDCSQIALATSQHASHPLNEYVAIIYRFLLSRCITDIPLLLLCMLIAVERGDAWLQSTVETLGKHRIHLVITHVVVH